MADADWQPPAAVEPAPEGPSAAVLALLERLAASPSAHGFYQTMRELEAITPERPRLGRSQRPRQDALRLAQEPSTIFASAALSSLEPGAEGRPSRLLVHFFGLFGPDGPLPLHLTDHARDRRRNHRDPSFQRFADIFHHRAMSLFWRAWADVRPTVSFDRPNEDRFQTYVGSLMGLGQDSLRNRDAMPDLTKLHFAGLFANQTRHASGLGAILSSFFTMPVQIECFIGAWLTMPKSDHSALGIDRRSGVLGESILLGASVWSRQNKFRIVIGPLSLAEYLRLLPGGQSFRRLIPIVRNYAGDTMLWDVNLVLRAEEIPRTVLGKQGRLGWTSWLHNKNNTQDAADLFLDASADSVARRFDENSPSPITTDESP